VHSSSKPWYCDPPWRPPVGPDLLKIKGRQWSRHVGFPIPEYLPFSAEEVRQIDRA